MRYIGVLERFKVVLDDCGRKERFASIGPGVGPTVCVTPSVVFCEFKF